MMNQWTPTISQTTAAQGHQPPACCANCAAANMGNVGFDLSSPFSGLDLPEFDQNTILIAAGVLAAGILVYQLMNKRKSGRSVATAKADYARRYAEETGRFPRF